MIYTGRSTLKKAYIGDKEVKAIYTGGEKVYKAIEPITDDMTILVVDNVAGKKIEFNSLGSYNGLDPIVDWGDGTKNYQLNHIYTGNGPYTIKIYNSTELSFVSWGSEHKTCLIEVTQLSTELTSIERVFANCSNLVKLGDKLRIPAGVTSCNGLFFDCGKLAALPDGFTIPEGVTNCFATFGRCFSLTSLPASFKLPSTLQIFPSLFNSCANLNVNITDILPTQFKPNKIDCGWAFEGTTLVKGIVPKKLFWGDTTVDKWLRITNCFSKSGVDNIDDIPIEWGGNLNPEPALKTYRISGCGLTSGSQTPIPLNGDYKSIENSEIPSWISSSFLGNIGDSSPVVKCWKMDPVYDSSYRKDIEGCLMILENKHIYIADKYIWDMMGSYLKLTSSDGIVKEGKNYVEVHAVGDLESWADESQRDSAGDFINIALV